MKHFLKINFFPFAFGFLTCFSISGYIIGVLGQRSSMLDNKINLIELQEKIIQDAVNNQQVNVQPKKKLVTKLSTNPQSQTNN